MSKPEIPRHIKTDAQKLAYDRTIESITRICDTFDYPDLLAAVASSSMSASFLMLYCAARLKHGPEISPATLFKIWGETMEEEFGNMAKGFDAAQEYVRTYDGR